MALRFLYDRGIPIWAGPLIGLLQRCGGIAIHRGRLDRPALHQARQVLEQGHYPLVIAPRATNNLSGEMAPLEPGSRSWPFRRRRSGHKERPPQCAGAAVEAAVQLAPENWEALDAG